MNTREKKINVMVDKMRQERVRRHELISRLYNKELTKSLELYDYLMHREYGDVFPLREVTV